MRWSARYFDGLTRRLLAYDLFVENGVADLRATWLLPEQVATDFEAQFMLDNEKIAGFVPALRSMNEEYDCCVTDLGTQQIIIEVGEVRIIRFVYGGKFVTRGSEELRPFMELFDWIHEQVMAQLPLPQEGVEDVY